MLNVFRPAFLLNNGIAYYYAHGFGLLEFIVEAYFAPQRKTLWPVTYIGAWRRSQCSPHRPH
jgi:hypothetical protein